jgi:DegV family protein with EDD domain
VTVAIGYLDGPRLRRSLMAAARWVAAGREELNRINVYPVPDGDTGTNFWFTCRSVLEALQRLGDAPLPEVSRAAAQAAVMGSRGNSGMMLSQFLVGFDEGVGARFRIRAAELALAIRRGFERLESSLENPVEGTILTVCREAAQGAELAVVDGADVTGVLRLTLRRAEEALERTPELLAELKRAGVVDAGGKGFVRMIEGIVRLIDGQAVEEAEEERRTIEELAPAALAEVMTERDYRYCTEVLLRGDSLPGSAEVRAALQGLGGSLQVLRTADLLRVHIHLNEPELLFRRAAEWGEVLTRKAEDMREQHRLLAGARRAIAVLCDTASDLPDELVDRHGISLVPMQLAFDDQVYADRFGIDSQEFFRRLRAGTVGTTSQPTAGEFTRGFEHARSGADEVVAVVLSSGLSGTFANAEAARRQFAAGGIHLFDSRTASLGAGLLAVRAAELAEAGWTPVEILAELARLRSRNGLFFTVDTLTNLVRSGRVSRARGWIGGLLDFKPIFTVDDEGKIAPVDRVRGRDALLPRVLALLDEALPAARERLRMGVVHADCEQLARDVRDTLQRRYRPVDIVVSPVTSVIANHTGPDAWGVFWQLEDGVPERARNNREPFAL